MAVALLFVNPIQPYSGRDVLLILGLGIIPTVVGHSLVNYAMKHFRGQIVSIINMGQFIFAGLMAYLLWGEVPAPTFFFAAVLLVLAAYVALGGMATFRRAVGAGGKFGVEAEAVAED